MNTLSQFTCGVVGCGQIGSAVTHNLLKHGVPVYVFDLNQEAMARLCAKGAKKVASATDLPSHCNVIITCLQRPEQVSMVMEGNSSRGIVGLFSKMPRGCTWIDHTTTDFNQVIRLQKVCQGLGIPFLEAPLTGGLQLLQQGEMVVFIGAGDKDFDRCLPLLKCYTGQQILTGAVSTATIIKVISNQLAGLNTVAMGESLLIAKRAGIDLSVMFDAIRASAGNSYVWETECPVAFNGSYDPGFTIDLHCKDLRLGREIAKSFGVTSELLGHVEEIYERARKAYGDNVGSSSPPRLLEDQYNTKLQAPGFDEWKYTVQRLEGGGIAVLHRDRRDHRATAQPLSKL